MESTDGDLVTGVLANQVAISHVLQILLVGQQSDPAHAKILAESLDRLIEHYVTNEPAGISGLVVERLRSYRNCLG